MPRAADCDRAQVVEQDRTGSDDDNCDDDDGCEMEGDGGNSWAWRPHYAWQHDVDFRI
ncbi:MAG: hypothetical protein ACRDL7_13695 [Gaiellaceae bacterium]